MKARRKTILDAHQLAANDVDFFAAKALRDVQYTERKQKVDELKKELFDI